MSKHFRPWNIDQTLLLPPNVRDFVPKDHVSRFIVELVRESLDLKAIMCSYVSGLGQPPFDPRMMVSLLLHGYASGLYSSRRIARACCERNDFVMIVALDPPDFRTVTSPVALSAVRPSSVLEAFRTIAHSIALERVSFSNALQSGRRNHRRSSAPSIEK